MSDVKQFLETFEKLQTTKNSLETEKVLLEKERTGLVKELQEIHGHLTIENLDTNIQALESKIALEIEKITIPEEYVDELNKMDRRI